jgi:hypothetical protein
MNTALLSGSSPYRLVAIDDPVMVDENTEAPNLEESVGYTLGDPVEYTWTHLSSTWTASANYTLTGAEVKMRRINEFDYTITCKIYADNGSGLPGTLLATSTTSLASMTVPDQTEALDWSEAQPFVFDFAGLAIRSGTRYHLTIVTGGAYAPETNSMMVQDNFELTTGESITLWDGADPSVYPPIYDCQFYFKTYGVVWVEKDQNAASPDDAIAVGYGAGFKYAGSSWTTATGYDLRNVRLTLYKAGSPTFDVRVAIYSDSSGPSTVLATSPTIIPAASLTTSETTKDFFFDGLALSASTKYHIIAYCNVIGDASNYVLCKINYGESTGEATTRDADGVAPFTAQYANSQLVFKTYGYPTA